MQATSSFGRFLIRLLIALHQLGTHLSLSAVPGTVASHPHLCADSGSFLAKGASVTPFKCPSQQETSAPCISTPRKCFPHQVAFFRNIETSCFFLAIILDCQEPVKKKKKYPRSTSILPGDSIVSKKAKQILLFHSLGWISEAI